MTTLVEEIISIAKEWEGEQEIRGNVDFKNPKFSTRMRAMGFITGDAWCSLFVELVWHSAYEAWDSTIISRLDKLFSKMAVVTYRNFQKTKDFIVDKKPAPGCLAVWCHYEKGKPTIYGHIGIVVEANIKWGMMITIEGNTNDDGGREGYEVAGKQREIDFDIKENGLTLMGFVHPKIV
jgi:hypothetical protein